MKPNVNLYSFSKKIFKEVMSDQYELHRRGLYDFPNREEWLEDLWRRFVSNNPELVGLKYDKETEDWIHEFEGGSIRTIIN